MEIRPLAEGDLRFPFSCGNRDLDLYWTTHALPNAKKHLNSTYVAADGPRIQGFLTVVSSTLDVESTNKVLGKGTTPFPAPILLLARLAVQKTVQKSGVGKSLIRHTLRIAIDQSKRSGCCGVLVHPKADSVGYYKALGFSPLELAKPHGAAVSLPPALFLPIQDILAALPETATSSPTEGTGQGSNSSVSRSC